MTLITGNTYPVKDQLYKEMGGKWDANSKGFGKFPITKAQEAQALVAKGATINPNAPKKEFVHYKCRECGCSRSRYVKIYRNGVCSNCYQDEKEEREMGY